MTADAPPPATGNACHQAQGRHRAFLAFFSLVFAMVGGAAPLPRAASTSTIQAWSCGAAALIGVAQRVDPDHAGVLADRLRNDPGLLQGARSMLDLAHAARNAGIDAHGVRVSGAEECPIPCIAHLRDGHFVAVINRRDDAVEFLDDGVACRVSRTEFTELFSGAVLVLGHAAEPSTFIGERP